MFRRGGGCRGEPPEREGLLERRERPMRVRNQPDLQSTRRQLPQHRLDIVIEKKVLVLGPFVVDLASALTHGRTSPTHLLNDAAGVADEDLAVVHVFLRGLA